MSVSTMWRLCTEQVLEELSFSVHSALDMRLGQNRYCVLDLLGIVLDRHVELFVADALVFGLATKHLCPLVALFRQ